MANNTAAKKIKLGARPESFSRAVSFQLPEGGSGCMEMIYKYRTRKEFAEFADTMQAALKAKGESEAEKIRKAAEDGKAIPEMTQADLIKLQDEFNVNYIMQAATGWNLDIPFDREAVEQMTDEFPAAVIAIIGAYRDAIVEGRLGN